MINCRKDQRKEKLLTGNPAYYKMPLTLKLILEAKDMAKHCSYYDAVFFFQEITAFLGD